MHNVSGKSIIIMQMNLRKVCILIKIVLSIHHINIIIERTFRLEINHLPKWYINS